MKGNFGGGGSSGGGRNSGPYGGELFIMAYTFRFKSPYINNLILKCIMSVPGGYGGGSGGGGGGYGGGSGGRRF